MMWLKRNLPVMIAAVIFCGMVGWSMLLLKQAKAAQSEAETKHGDLEGRLKGLLDAPIFPNKENIDILKVQAEQLNDYYRAIYNRLPKEKKEYPRMDNWKCKGLLETRVNEMRKECLANKVQVNASFSYGFSKYMGTQPPKEEDTPDLLHQLDLAEKIMKLLVQSKVSEITTFRRTFLAGETGADEKVDGAVWRRDANTLYDLQTFEVTIRSSDEQLRVVLNNLGSATNLVLLVRTIGINSDPARPKEADKSSGGPNPDASRTAAGPGATPPGMAFPPGMPQPPAARGGARQSAGAPAPADAKTSSAAAPAIEAQIVMGYESVTTALRIDVIEVHPATEAEENAKETAKAAGAPAAKQE